MKGKPSLVPKAGLPAKKTDAAVTPVSIFDRVLNFPGTRPEFATLLLASAVSSGMLRQGVIFIWNGPDLPPSMEGALPAFPEGETPPWMQSIIDYLTDNPLPTQTRVFSADPAAKKKSLGGLLVPLSPGERAFAAFEMADIQPAAMTALLQNMDFFASLWRYYLNRQRESDPETFAPAMGVLAVVNRTDRFQKFSMSLVNEIASRFGADRVALGFLKGKYVRLRAVSHAEKFGKGMNLVRALEMAMEECVDQDSEALFPEPRGFTGVSRALAELCRHFGSGGAMAIPLRDGDKPAGALVIERASSEPADPKDVKLLRLVAELVSPRLMELKRHDRWFGARFGSWCLRILGKIAGPTHTLAKLAALGCIAAAWYLSTATGEYKVDSTFVTQPVEQRVVSAPYEGFVRAVHVKPGEVLSGGETLMLELETSELRSQLAMRRAEQRSYEKEASLARRDNKVAESQVADAKVEQMAAECELLEERIRQSRIYAPMDGVALSGDWTKRIGAPVKQGEPLFEVAPIENMEADLYVPEDDISDVRLGQTGELAPAGRPDVKVRFIVTRITPMAEMVKNNNVFRVQVSLVSPPDWLRPGIEGVAKIDVDERLLIDIWTRRAINWVRMKLWW